MDNAAHMSEEIRSEYMKENYEDILELASGGGRQDGAGQTGVGRQTCD